jgi:hypothetical protein
MQTSVSATTSAPEDVGLTGKVNDAVRTAG